MKTTKSIRYIFGASLIGVSILMSQISPTVYDTDSGIEDNTNGGVRVSFYTSGLNEVALRSAFAFERATVALALPLKHVFNGPGRVFTTPPSLSLGYRIMDYREDLIQVFGGLSTRAMGSYDINLHLLVQPTSLFALLATVGSANEIVERIESDSLTVYKISSTPDIGLAVRLQFGDVPVLNNWFLTGLWANDSFEINEFNTKQRSFITVGRQYDKRLSFELRVFHGGQRQLVINYKFN